ncbi:hypothetical protein ACVR0O_05815 [Streptococcus caviae]|uniref:hypothetical protein n=1 Tax=Streptococcus sp. 'caviae' TaxID=1915004 RepID=UPI00094BB44F|nr:hypothetical protein [Streptococcus sp. 'caviae']OLN83537.1 hypothetical protein BMI76_05180 [Streptococcus sp. 'caviae']
MNQNEWQQQFRAANGREPSQEEFQAAFQRGEFTETRQKAKKKMKTSTIVIISVVSALAVLLLIAAGATGYYYYTGNIDGVWERDSSSFYSSKKDKWIDLDKQNETYGMDYHSFLNIKKGSVKTYAYYRLKNYDGLGSDESYNYVGSVSTAYTGHIRPMHKVNVWKREFELSISQEDFLKDMNRYIKDHIESRYSTTNYIQQLKDSYKKDFKNQKKERVSYQKKGSRLIVKGYNKKGKLTNKAIYIKRTGKAADKLSKAYKKAVNDERKALEKLNSVDY